MHNYNVLLENLVSVIDKHEINLDENEILNLLRIRNRWFKSGDSPPVVTISQWINQYWGEYYDSSGLFLFEQWKKTYDLGFTTILSDVTDLTSELRELEDKIRKFSGTRGNANFYLTKGSNLHRVSFADHCHHYDVIVKMIYGKCVWKIDNEYVEMQNNTILIPANTVHSVVECTDKKLSLTVNLNQYMKYNKGDIFLDKNTHKLYIFDGDEWWEIVPSSYLKKPDWT